MRRISVLRVVSADMTPSFVGLKRRVALAIAAMLIAISQQESIVGAAQPVAIKPEDYDKVRSANIRTPPHYGPLSRLCPCLQSFLDNDLRSVGTWTTIRPPGDVSALSGEYLRSTSMGRHGMLNLMKVSWMYISDC